MKLSLIGPGSETSAMTTFPLRRSGGRPRRLARAPRSAAAALAVLTLGLSAPAPTSSAKSAYGVALEGPGRSVVAVRFQLRPKERPTGGEGPKVR